MLCIDINSTSDYILVTLGGILDGGETELASQKITQALIHEDDEETVKTNLIIDLSNLDYISSGGLGILLIFHRKVGKAGYLMIICNPSPMAAKLLTTTGMYGVFQIQPSVDSAIKTLST